MEYMVTATVYEGSLEMSWLEDRVLRALDDAQLLSGAWRGIAFKDLPEAVQRGLDEAIEIVRDQCADSDYCDD